MCFYIINKFRKCIEKAKFTIERLGKENITRPGKVNSLYIEVHLSWDFAQQVQLPSSSQQEVNCFKFFLLNFITKRISNQYLLGRYIF